MDRSSCSGVFGGRGQHAAAAANDSDDAWLMRTVRCRPGVLTPAPELLELADAFLPLSEYRMTSAPWRRAAFVITRHCFSLASEHSQQQSSPTTSASRRAHCTVAVLWMRDGSKAKSCELTSTDNVSRSRLSNDHGNVRYHKSTT